MKISYEVSLGITPCIMYYPIRIAKVYLLPVSAILKFKT